MIRPIPPVLGYDYFQWVYCTGGTLANSGEFRVECQPEDDYNTLLQRSSRRRGECIMAAHN